MLPASPNMQPSLTVGSPEIGSPDIGQSMSVDGLFVPESPLQDTVLASGTKFQDSPAEMTANAGNDGQATMTLLEKHLKIQKIYAEVLRQRYLGKATQELPLPQVIENPTKVSPPLSQALGRSKSANDLAAIAFAAEKKTFERRKKAGKVSFTDDIEWMQKTSAEEARLRKVETDAEYDRTLSPEPTAEESMFVSEDEMAYPPPFSALISDGEEETPKRGQKRASADDQSAGRPKKKARKVNGTNYREGDEDDVLTLVAKRQKMAKAGKKAAAKPKAKAASKRTGNTVDRMTNLNSIMGTNVFDDTAATKDLPNQPRFEKGGGRRHDALKSLISSLPAESRKVGASDKKYLDDCIKDFTGHGVVKPHEDGNWSLRGMRSTLKHYQVAGVAFMRRRENASSAPFGGILADQMGLGKTVEMLANIVNGEPAPLQGTARRISNHCLYKREHKSHGLGTVIQYHAGARLASNNILELLETAAIVLTTCKDFNYPHDELANRSLRS